MLTTNQAILLDRVCHDAWPPTTKTLAEVSNDKGHAFCEDAARNAMARMEKRGLVTRSGVGKLATWTITQAGREELGVDSDEVEVKAPAEDGTKPLRKYIVLEKMSLAQAVREALADELITDDVEKALLTLNGREVYDSITFIRARNTEHAYRQVAKDVYDGQNVTPELVAVATKMFQPQKVAVRNRQTVSVG